MRFFKRAAKDGCPPTTPQEVWTAKRLFMKESEFKKKQFFMKQWKDIRALFKIDDKHAYLRDSKGNFIRTQPGQRINILTELPVA